MNTGDTALVLISAAFVFLMTPALGFFYGGLGRRKNVVSNLMNSFFILGLATVLWVAVGFSLSFGQDHGGVIGDFSWAFFNHVGFEPGPYGETIPFLAFALFQMMFAIITPALITGSIAGRMKFKALFIFILLWSVIVYYPIAHMVWGHDGWLERIGVADFAGGDVVHISSGVTALLLCIALVSLRFCCVSPSGNGKISSPRVTAATTCPSSRSARASSGSGGSVSTPVPRSAPTVWQLTRSPRPRSRPLPPC